MKPDIGKLATERLILARKVDFITGFNWSNVLLASLKPAVDSQTFLISGNAGPSQIAGELCSPYFFSTSWQNDQTPMALGETLNNRGVKRLFILAPNYAAGKDMAAGVKKTFKGEIVGEEYTGWPGQLDFSAELTKVRSVKPDAVWVSIPDRPARNSCSNMRRRDSRTASRSIACSRWMRSRFPRSRNRRSAI